MTIACELFDYIEIACLFHYDVPITLEDGQLVSGRARDTITGGHRGEAIVLEDNLNRQVSVPTQFIVRMDVNTENARFTSVDFREPSN